MAHKTVALTTELREHLKPEQVENVANKSSADTWPACGGQVRACCGRRTDRIRRTRCTVGSSATAPRVGPGTVQTTLLGMWRRAEHQPAQTSQMGICDGRARAQESLPRASTTSTATPCGERARDLWLIRPLL